MEPIKDYLKEIEKAFAASNAIVVVCFFVFLIMILQACALPVLAGNVISTENKGQNINITISDKQDKPWWLDTAIQILTILTGFGVVIYQMQKQHKNSIDIEECNAMKKLHLDIYQKIANQVNKAQKSEKLSIESITLPDKIWDYVSSGKQNRLPERYDDICKKYHKYCADVHKLMIIMEEYEIALYRFGIFRIVISCQLERLGKTHVEFTNQIIKYLPVDLPDHINMPALPLQSPTEADIQNLKKLGSNLYDSILDMSCYLYDFKVEAQNHLLGKLFSRKIRPRIPTDNSYIVITTDIKDIGKIIDHFDVKEDIKQKWVDVLIKDNQSGSI